MRMNADELLRHGAFLRRLAASLLRGEEGVDDVIQHAYVKALESHPRHPRAWLAKVVRNLVYERLRLRSRARRRERVAARRETLPSPADYVERLEVQRQVVAAVLSLREPYRSTIMQRYFDELTPREIARRTGVPYETVRTRLGRALRELRRRLDAEHASWALALAPLLLCPPRLAVLGGVLMSAKKTTLLVILPLVGCIVVAVLVALLARIPEGATDGPERKQTRAVPLGKEEVHHTDTEGRASAQLAQVESSHKQAESAEQFVRGAVTDGRTRDPIVGALVVLTDPNDARIVAPRYARSTRTDEDGEFVLAADPEQPVILVQATGYLPALEKAQVETQNLIALKRGVSISGRVVSEAGAPIEGARVWATLETNRVAWPNTTLFLTVSRRATGAEDLTDSAGYYELRGLSPDTSYALKCSKPAHTFRRWRDPPVVRAGRGPVQELVLGAVCRLATRAVDSQTGEPVPNAEFQLSYRTRDVIPPIDYQRGYAATVDEPEGGFLPDGWVRRTLARNNAGVQDERFKVKVYYGAPGYANVSREIPLSEGTVRVEILMEREGEQAWGGVLFSFRFRKSARPFAGDLLMRVWSLDKKTRGQARVRVVDGQATGPVKLPLGRYRFEFMGFGDRGNWWRDAGRVTRLDVTGRETRCDVELDGTPVRLTVRDPDGRLLRGYDMVVKTSRGRPGGAAFWDVPSHHSMSFRPTRMDSDTPDFYVPSGKTRVVVSFPGAGSFETTWDAAGDGTVKSIDAVLTRDE